MTEFSIPADDWRFALAMVLVCIPFIILVLLLQTRICAVLMAKAATWIKERFTYGLAWLRAGRDTGGGDNWSTAPTAARMGRKRRLMALDEEGRRGSGGWIWEGWLNGKGEGREGREGRV